MPKVIWRLCLLQKVIISDNSRLFDINEACAIDTLVPAERRIRMAFHVLATGMVRFLKSGFDPICRRWFPNPATRKVSWLLNWILVAACFVSGFDCSSGWSIAQDRPSSLDREEPKRKAIDRAPRLFCILIGGMDSDPSPAQIAGTARGNEGNSGLYRLLGELKSNGVDAEYFNWNGTRAGDLKNPESPKAAAIIESIRQHVKRRPQDRIAIVGNSWGGHTAFEVARDLARSELPLAIDLVIFLDPSSTGRAMANPKGRPVTVNSSVNYFTRNRFVWGKLNLPVDHLDIDLGDPKNGFMTADGARYDATFDFNSHVAAEWDPKIHADIRKRLLALDQGDQ